MTGAATQVGGYEIFLHDYNKMGPVSEDIVQELPIDSKSTTIKNIYPNIFDWLALQNKTIAIVLIIMIVIATLNLITCLLILVLERTRMIGCAESTGAARYHLVQPVFLVSWYAFITFFAVYWLGNVIGLRISCWLLVTVMVSFRCRKKPGSCRRCCRCDMVTLVLVDAVPAGKSLSRNVLIPTII